MLLVNDFGVMDDVRRRGNRVHQFRQVGISAEPFPSWFFSLRREESESMSIGVLFEKS